MKKYLSFVLVLVMVLSFSLVAAAKTEVEVTFWWLSSFMDYLERMEAEYEAQNPDVDIILDNVDGNIAQALTTRINAGEAPDLVNLNNSTALTFYLQGALEPVDLYLDPADRYEYIDAIWESTMFDGVFNYAFPWYASPAILMYNKDIFTEAGLNPNDPPGSWEEVYEYGKTIKDATGLPSVNIELQNIAWEMTMRVGESVFNEDLTAVAFNQPKVAARLQYLADLYAEGIMPQDLPDYQTTQDLFANGQIAMFPLGASMVAHIQSAAPDLNFGVAPYPVSPGGANVVHVSMMNLVLMKSSEVKEEAVEFAKWFSSHGPQIEFCKEATIVPSTKIGLASDPYFAEANSIALVAQTLASNSMKNAAVLEMKAVPEGWDEIQSVIRDNFMAAVRGEVTVQEALDTAEEQANEIISQLN